MAPESPHLLSFKSLADLRWDLEIFPGTQREGRSSCSVCHLQRETNTQYCSVTWSVALWLCGSVPAYKGITTNTCRDKTPTHRSVLPPPSQGQQGQHPRSSSSLSLWRKSGNDSNKHPPGVLVTRFLFSVLESRQQVLVGHPAVLLQGDLHSLISRGPAQTLIVALSI